MNLYKTIECTFKLEFHDINRIYVILGLISMYVKTNSGDSFHNIALWIVN